MARIRTIKPEYPKDEILGSCSRDARLLYPLLWLIADDSGHFRASSAIIKGECFPYDEDLSLKDVRKILEELIKAGRVLEYEASGQKYGFMPKFLLHQRIDKPSQFRFPKHPSEESPPNVPPTPRVLQEPSVSTPDSMGSGMDLEGKGRGTRKGGERGGEPAKSAAALDRPSGASQPREKKPETSAEIEAHRERVIRQLRGDETAQA